MRTKVVELAEQLAGVNANDTAEDGGEAAAFLRWLEDGHFTVLGCIETDVVSGDDGRARFEVRSDAALGLALAGKRYADADALIAPRRSEEHTSVLQSLMRISY